MVDTHAITMAIWIAIAGTAFVVVAAAIFIGVSAAMDRRRSHLALDKVTPRAAESPKRTTRKPPRIAPHHG